MSVNPSLLNAMVDWEEGSLDHEEEVELFQELVNSGMAWQLQGCYGRNAARLIEAGYVSTGNTG